MTIIARAGQACELKSGNGGLSILPTWYEYLPGKLEKDNRCAVDFVFPDHIGAILLAVVDILLRIGALVAVGYVIYGGFMYMMSQGEPDKAAAAQKTILNAVIGFVIAIIATGAVSFIGNRLLA